MVLRCNFNRIGVRRFLGPNSSNPIYLAVHFPSWLHSSQYIIKSFGGMHHWIVWFSLVVLFCVVVILLANETNGPSHGPFQLAFRPFRFLFLSSTDRNTLARLVTSKRSILGMAAEKRAYNFPITQKWHTLINLDKPLARFHSALLRFPVVQQAILLQNVRWAFDTITNKIWRSKTRALQWHHKKTNLFTQYKLLRSLIMDD